MHRRHHFGSRKGVILLLLTALPAASQPVTVEQMQQTIAAMKAAKTSDAAMAAAIHDFELTERLTNPTLDRIKAEEKPGRKTLLSLELASYLSSFLNPPSSELSPEVPPDAVACLSMISAARTFVATTLRHMPDFLATRITRAFDDSSTASSHRHSEVKLMGTMSQEITYRDGRETAFRAPDATITLGLTSKGEFGPILDTVLTDSSRGTVTWSHWEKTAVGLAAVFHYQVSENTSHYAVDYCCENGEYPDFPSSFYHGTPAYHGSLFIDPRSGAILRLTVEAELNPSDPITRASVAVEYGNVDIGGKSYICPVESIAISSARSYLEKEKRDTTILRINEAVFTNYHRFGSTSRVLSTSPSR